MMNLSKLIVLHDRWATAVSNLQSVLLLLLRLYIGARFYFAGIGKLLNLERTSGFFASLGIPAPGLNAMLAGTTEMVGGLLLFIGLGSRIVTVPLVFTMLVAYATAHSDSLATLFSKPSDFVDQEPFLFLTVSLLVLAFGPGRFSFDALLGKKIRRRYSSPR